jgi:hypothetical protein
LIISVSRRTDIPAFYPQWFVNRVRRGWCHVPNPFNKKQVSLISLQPEEVDAFVFWTRNPRPLMHYLDELDARGFRYCFLHTLIGYPGRIDPGSPPLDVAIRNFRELSERIGPARITWRYDPILLSSLTGLEFHRKNFRQIARALRGYTDRCVISFVKPYRKVRARLKIAAPDAWEDPDFGRLEIGEFLQFISKTARDNGLQVFSCAAERDMAPFGILPGKCIDAELLSHVFGIRLECRKDPSQRKECGCSASRDIGMYDTCLFGCSYCYATSSQSQARANHAGHNPESPSLI